MNTIYDHAIQKIHLLPEPVVKELNDFIDFLLIREDHSYWDQWIAFLESVELSEYGISEYRNDLEDYEDKLLCGKIKW